MNSTKKKKRNREHGVHCRDGWVLHTNEEGGRGVPLFTRHFQFRRRNVVREVQGGDVRAVFRAGSVRALRVGPVSGNKWDGVDSVFRMSHSHNNVLVDSCPDLCIT